MIFRSFVICSFRFESSSWNILFAKFFKSSAELIWPTMSVIKAWKKKEQDCCLMRKRWKKPKNPAQNPEIHGPYLLKKKALSIWISTSFSVIWCAVFQFLPSHLRCGNVYLFQVFLTWDLMPHHLLVLFWTLLAMFTAKIIWLSSSLSSPSSSFAWYFEVVWDIILK